jgi:hypothetical protein
VTTDADPLRLSAGALSPLRCGHRASPVIFYLIGSEPVGVRGAPEEAGGFGAGGFGPGGFGPGCLRLSAFRAQDVQGVLQVLRVRAFECDLAAVGGVLERQADGVQPLPG